ncbi:MAG TPA: hypothetical protein VMT36_05715 [Candidatus Saccharimonadia bacterium]|nr:hypothetical protein [Candidatus Saccharimonadia bacterium]
MTSEGVLAAGLNLDLDQWAPLTGAWQNGDLNGNNASFPEGGVVPFRLAIEGLDPGAHSIHINYDFTAGGHKAYDYLATWNATLKPKLCDPKGGGISSLCPSLPASNTRAFPSDAFKANGLTVAGAETFGKVPRRLTLYGGTITSISGPDHSGSVNGNSTADFTVKFRSTASAVLFAWGGHLAMSKYWDVAADGPVDGAGQVSGAPWHMRTLQLDGSGNRNQDRSIQPSAISGSYVPPAVSSTPRPAPQQPPGTTTSSPKKTPIPWSLAPATSVDGSPTGPGTPIDIAIIILFAAIAVAVGARLPASRDSGRHRR